MSTSRETMIATMNNVANFPNHPGAYLQHMRDDDFSHDVAFVVNGHRFLAHGSFMAATSQVYRSMWTNGMKELEVEPLKSWLEYMYIVQVKIFNVYIALEYLKCAVLVDVTSAITERNLARSNSFEILGELDAFLVFATGLFCLVTVNRIREQ